MEDGLLTHARDNLVHHFSLCPPPADPSTFVVDLGRWPATAVPSPASPSHSIQPVWSMAVESMNYRKMSVLELSPDSSSAKGQRKAVEAEGLVAVPSLTTDDFVYISHIPSRRWRGCTVRRLRDQGN
ncbi:hypothetical protein JCM5296_007302 [Sporobolomyces johnsonii]